MLVCCILFIAMQALAVTALWQCRFGAENLVAFGQINVKCPWPSGILTNYNLLWCLCAWTAVLVFVIAINSHKCIKDSTINDGSQQLGVLKCSYKILKCWKNLAKIQIRLFEISSFHNVVLKCACSQKQEYARTIRYPYRATKRIVWMWAL